MKSRWLAFLFIAVLAFAALGARAASKKPAAGQLVDAGSFGIFVNGRRVATETFQIEQRDGASTARSELKVEDGTKGGQTSEMQLNAAGDLMRYEWRENKPGTAQTVVEPNNEFLIEHVLLAPTDKPRDVPFLLPHSTVILDDNFFMHRQILAWRYLGSSCTPTQGKVECKLSRTQFGILVPQQQVSGIVALEYGGRETIKYKGADQPMNRINLKSENTSDWSLWLDDNNKVVRIVIADSNTEAVRD